MRKVFYEKLILGVMFMFVLFGVRDARAEREGLLSKLDIQASGAMDFYSSYVWRGFTLDKDPVLQPSFSLSSKGLTFTFWSSWDADNNNSASSDEMDFVFDYTKSFGSYDISVGHTYYDFPGTNGYSKEFYVGISTEQVPLLKWPISIGFKYYRDYGDQNNGGGLGNYFETSLGYSMTVFKEPEITMDLSLTQGYNRNLFLAGNGGQTTLGIGFNVPLTKNLTFSPKVNYTIPYGDLADDALGNQDDICWGGFSMSYSF